MKPHLLIFGLLLCLPQLLFANTYAVSHSRYVERSSLIFPTDSSAVVYEDFPTAIEILEVQADQKPVEGVVRFSAGTPDLAETDVGDARMVYSRLIRYLMTYVDPYRSKQMKMYTIDPQAGSIVIKYRVRLPGGKVSEVHELRSTLQNPRPN